LARRRYGKSPAISTAGQSDRPRDPTGDESLAQPIQPKQEYGKAEPTTQPRATSEPAQHFSTGLGEQLRAQQQQQQFDALDAYISQHFPGAWPNERAALGANQVWLANPGLVHAAGRIALERGIPRQSPEFLQAIGALIDQHLAAMQAQPAPPPPPPPMPPMPAQTHVDVESHEAEPEDEPMPTHFSAPVSRGSERGSVEPEPSASSITLTAAQREIANLPGGAGEVEYAKQLLKMQRAKKAGLLKD
jgi:hypothetical protein